MTICIEIGTYLSTNWIAGYNAKEDWINSTILGETISKIRDKNISNSINLFFIENTLFYYLMITKINIFDKTNTT